MRKPFAISSSPAARAEQIALVEAYAKAQGLWRIDGAPAADYTDVVELDLSTVEPSLAGPKRPQDRVPLRSAKSVYQSERARKWPRSARQKNPAASGTATAQLGGKSVEIKDGAVLIAAITSCTNTSNPAVLVAAGLLARNANALGLDLQALGEDLARARLARGHRLFARRPDCSRDLEALGFYTVGYGCTTCIGNSGPLKPEISEAVRAGDVVACSVLSGNRNFEGRVHPEIKMNFLASPPLVVAYALAGSLDIDITTEPLGNGQERQAGLPQGYLAERRGSGEDGGRLGRLGHVHQGLRQCVPGRCQLARHQDAGRQDLCVGRQIDLREESAVLRRHDHDAGGRRRHQGCAGARGARRFGDDRSHLAGRQHLQIESRRRNT